MPKYTINGDRVQKFTTVVEAPDAFEAIDQASNVSQNEWTELETDEVIEAYEAVEQVLVDDEWPVLESGIISDL
jgi:hypothetical protein